MAASLDPQALAMDRMYRRQRLIYDATRKYYLLGRDRLIGDLAPGDGAGVLEVGCGTGRNLIVAAKRYPHARFCGLDISREMLDTAAANVRRAGLEGRIALAKGDAAAFDAQRLFGVQAFERVFCAYTLSMIPPWQAALAQGARLVAPNGALFVVDFGRMDELPRWFRHFMKAWLAKFSVTPRGSLGDAVQRLDGFRVETASLYRGYAQYAVARRP
jgi:S-adenosylmethionine-diacylgycerolhomoserine-N-methlytransferase